MTGFSTTGGRGTATARRAARALVAGTLALLVSIISPRGAVAQPLPWFGSSGHGAQLLREAALGSRGPDAADFFGPAAAAGDLIGDSHDDSAIGAPGNPCSSNFLAGNVDFGDR